LFDFGVNVAVDREITWEKFLRTLPVSPSQRLVTVIRAPSEATEPRGVSRWVPTFLDTATMRRGPVGSSVRVADPAGAVYDVGGGWAPVDSGRRTR